MVRDPFFHFEYFNLVFDEFFVLWIIRRLSTNYPCGTCKYPLLGWPRHAILYLCLAVQDMLTVQKEKYSLCTYAT